MIHDSIHEYNENVYTTFLKGDAREESYYQYLAKLVYDISVSIGYTAVSITTLPKKLMQEIQTLECGMGKAII
ncbi:MAG TPA: hypothetical protein PLH80_02590 [Spirochaetota bacterium]|nr:hypothetical protein [Spirochaetota bacterium]HRR61341.1 hypothetical protein [Spirochaetota bacterium]